MKYSSTLAMKLRVLNSALVVAVSAASLAQLPAEAHERHEYDLQDVKWDLSFDFAKGTIKGTVTDTLTTSKSGAMLVFDCPKLTIDKVTVNGVTTRFETNETVLGIPTKAKKGQKLTVRISYHGAPEAGIYFVPAKYAFPAKTPVLYTQGEMVDNRYWMPIYDWPNDKATSAGTIHVPKGWKALSNGALQGVTKGKSEDIWSWKIAKPHATYLISLVAGPYDIVPDGHANVPVTMWMPEGLGSWGQAAFGGTDKIVDFYGKLTGFPYPWEKYSQSAVPDFMFGGMENVTCTTQTIGAIFPPSYAGYNNATGLVAHELAHQWFGDTVTCPDWPHAWINEGWASFLPSFWTRESEGEEAYSLARQGTIDGAAGTALAQSDRAMIHTKYKHPFDLFDGFAYGGGAARMFMLMHEVGEAKFWKAIKTYLHTRGFENVTTEQFFATMSKETGRDLDAFRRQWFYIKGAPQLTVIRDGEHTIVKQAKYPLAYAVPLDVWLVDKEGKIEKRRVALTEDAEVEIKGANGRTVLLDPECWLMGSFKYEADYSSAEWETLYRVAPNAGSRSRLMDNVLKHVPVPTLLALARRETSPALIESFVSRIQDKSYVLDMTNSPVKPISATAVSALGNFGNDPQVIAKLRRIWSTATFGEVMQSRALGALMAAAPSNELAEEAWNRPCQTKSFQQQALAYWVRTDKSRARSLCLQLVRSDDTAEPIRMDALRALGQLNDEPGKREVYDALVVYLHERSNSPLRTAIGALADYGDKAAIPLIAAHKNHSLFFVRNDVENALARLSR